MAQRPPQKKKSPAKPRQPVRGGQSRGARINQLFQDAIRDLEALKQKPRRGRA